MLDFLGDILRLVIVLWPALLFCGVYLWWHYRNFRQSSYSSATGNGFFRTITDKGLYGEYLTYVILEACPGYKKILANVYVPKDDGTTTEVDVIMLHEAGIYVFESKNFSGWIFGRERDSQWTQMLNKRTKKKFFNPIWQNKGHVAALQKVLVNKEVDPSTFRAYIVFSERCDLKKVTVDSPDVWVLKRNELRKQLKIDTQATSGAISRQTIHMFNEILAPYTHVDHATKDKHIANVRRKSIVR